MPIPVLLMMTAKRVVGTTTTEHEHFTARRYVLAHQAKTRITNTELFQPARIRGPVRELETIATPSFAIASGGNSLNSLNGDSLAEWTHNFPGWRRRRRRVRHVTCEKNPK
uniref:(northern house mosquito) hypothetical protein n=1 Tax=Culex pipiens TaxID=7175 RepID=A0A8D8P2U3_CULPI